MASPNRIPEIRTDTVNNRWVIFSPARSRRPSDFKSKSNPSNPTSQPECPFCIGHELECAPEIFRVPAAGPDWRIRVIKNLYPALSRDLESSGELGGRPGDGRVALSGFGFHDVVIESPVHPVRLPDLDPVEIGDVFMAYKKRIEQLQCYDSIQYVQVFKNYGASAGASMSHSHSQMIALPVVPPTVSTRLDSMKEYFGQTGKLSLKTKENLQFLQAIDLGRLLKLTLRKMNVQLNSPPFNFMIQSSPLQVSPTQLPYTHWFLQIVPQLSVVGGFEMGTGCYINPIFPEDAAKLLREVSISS
ncbi:hypothetical protein RJ639_007586 [Escallonia herrerae]|uniref:Galactose-1-phosphate uridyl transferase N-terminal domain-containing protein n=1 Tax=Escallonia herrerae TaxID=1293975 RepID=A0AA89AWV8_9ASTE|nr:hypothetical protein RJ639_007586 [Escallonia herrerae]